MTDVIGWLATLVFVASYFAKSPTALRRTQMVGATLWATYGVMLGAPPVIAANVLLILAAAWTAARASRKGGDATPA